jgi:cytochrome oxidase assembly protein ShyY1
MRLRFRFRVIPFLATVLLVALGIVLGNWQQGRAAQKIALRDKLAQRGAEPPLELGPLITPLEPLEYRRVRVTGQFVSGWPVFLDNRPFQGRSGFYLLMPFKIAGSDTHVLVARGWLPADPTVHTRLPVYTTPAGQVTIEGVIAGSVGHVLQLGAATGLHPNAMVQNLEPGAFAQASGLKVQPFFVEQTGPQERGPQEHGPQEQGSALVRDWPAPSTGIEKHKGYAFQWYALAAMAFLFFVITGFRSGTKHNDAARP